MKNKCKWCKTPLEGDKTTCDICKSKLREVKAKVFAATSHDTPCLDGSCGRCKRCNTLAAFSQGDGETCEDCGKQWCICEAPTRTPAARRMR